MNMPHIIIKLVGLSIRNQPASTADKGSLTFMITLLETCPGLTALPVAEIATHPARTQYWRLLFTP
jgi:hypothetical protein